MRIASKISRTARYGIVALVSIFHIAGDEASAIGIAPRFFEKRDFPDVPKTIEKHCGIFNDYMRRKHAKEEPTGSIGSLHIYEWGGEKYECFVPKDPKEKHTIRNCDSPGVNCP